MPFANEDRLHLAPMTPASMVSGYKKAQLEGKMMLAAHPCRAFVAGHPSAANTVVQANGMAISRGLMTASAQVIIAIDAGMELGCRYLRK